MTGRIIVSEFSTLDGVMGEPTWTFGFPNTEDQLKFKLDELFSSEALLLGRVTYEGFAKAWPNQQDDQQGYGKRMNSMPKYVVSNSPLKSVWNNSRLVKTDSEMGKIKEQSAGDILVFGSLTLAGKMLENGLVDELRLMVFPIFLGSGRRFFSEASKSKPKLVEAKRFDSGVALLRYKF